ncbi:MAG: GNAT family N-acetyltransferase [Dehalococcoidales bacterium]|nr:MAG: GNAT family N-acetyltransferase [Dehalococcoidales bacterium]
MLKGSKVTLRPVNKSDVEYMTRWMSDAEVTRYITPYLPITEMAEEKYVEILSMNTEGSIAYFIIDAIERDHQKPVGAIELGDINTNDHCASFGISIGEKDYWSKGYGTEAAQLIIRYGFEQLNLHRISSVVFSFNERSLRLHTKVGFIQEGLRREAWYRDGEYHDEVLFGLLRKEWQVKNKPKET